MQSICPLSFLDTAENGVCHRMGAEPPVMLL